MNRTAIIVDVVNENTTEIPLTSQGEPDVPENTRNYRIAAPLLREPGMHGHDLPSGDTILFNPLSETEQGAIVEGEYISGHGVIVPGQYTPGAPVMAPGHIDIEWLQTQEDNVLAIKALHF
mgnify:CR=1 FL=1